MSRSLFLAAAVCLVLTFAVNGQEPAPIRCLNTSGVFTTDDTQHIVRTLKYANMPLLLYIEKEKVTIYGFYLREEPSSLSGYTAYHFKGVDRQCYQTRDNTVAFVKERYKNKAVAWR